MAADANTWARIHAERGRPAGTHAKLAPEQWQTPSLCAKWTVGQLAAHILAGAEQTPGHFFGSMAASAFRFNSAMDRDIEARSPLSQRQIVDRLRQRLDTTNRPPAPVEAMLGEAVV